MDLIVSSPNAAPFTGGSDNFHSNVRYDYAGRIAGKYKGTVFTPARVELVMSKKDPAVNESVLHIYDALYRPERTFPSWVGGRVRARILSGAGGASVTGSTPIGYGLIVAGRGRVIFSGVP
jgi:hypothetical protein